MGQQQEPGLQPLRDMRAGSAAHFVAGEGSRLLHRLRRAGARWLLAFGGGLAWGVAGAADAPPSATAETADSALLATPHRLTRQAWSFRVHSVHDADALASAVLVVDGRALRPKRWKLLRRNGGREWLLGFEAPRRHGSSMELRLLRQGEKVPRVFRWMRMH